MELGPELFAVKVLGAFESVGLFDGLQRLGIFGQPIDLQGHALPLEGSQVQEGPPVGPGVGQLDFKLARRAARAGQAH